jgi:uncharacterized GH25 family protein
VRRRALAAALVGAAALCGAAARGHDFWIEPTTFRADKGATVALRLRVGDHFLGDPVLRTGSMIERFVVRQGGRDVEVGGIEGADPAGWFVAEGGGAVVAYESRPAAVELDGPRFEAYLRRHGLEWVSSARARSGESDEPGREVFSRHAKAVLASGRPGAAASRPLGLRYEIVPTGDPSFTAALRGRVLYEGAPVRHALVTALSRHDPRVRLQTRSDDAGAFALALPLPGVWLVESVWMVEAPFFSRGDWESLWASLTFELGARPRGR